MKRFFRFLLNLILDENVDPPKGWQNAKKQISIYNLAEYLLIEQSYSVVKIMGFINGLSMYENFEWDEEDLFEVLWRKMDYSLSASPSPSPSPAPEEEEQDA